MNSITELAKMIKGCENPSPYTPMFGRIISLPDLKIQLGTKILLSADNIKAIFDIYETHDYDGHKEYIHLNKEVVLLPYSGKENKFVAIGVIM